MKGDSFNDNESQWQCDIFQILYDVIFSTKSVRWTSERRPQQNIYDRYTQTFSFHGKKQSKSIQPNIL